MRKVVAVFDPSFGPKLSELARRHHVWIVESTVNQPHIEESWSRQGSHSLDEGVTSFAAVADEAPEAQLVRIADTMADHHGPGMQEPPWSELCVYGVRPVPEVVEALAALGFVRIEPTADGFCAYSE